jgi:hypothetical protein
MCDADHQHPRSRNAQVAAARSRSQGRAVHHRQGRQAAGQGGAAGNAGRRSRSLGRVHGGAPDDFERMGDAEIEQVFGNKSCSSATHASAANGTNLTVSTRSLRASFPRKREPRATKSLFAARDPHFRGADEGMRNGNHLFPVHTTTNRLDQTTRLVSAH